jgi:hypothetical protein
VFLELFIMVSLSSSVATLNLTPTGFDFYDPYLGSKVSPDQPHIATLGDDIADKELKRAVPKMVCEDPGFLGNLWKGVGSIWNEINSMWSGEKTPPPEPLCRVDGPAKQPTPINQRVPFGDAGGYGHDILFADASGTSGGGVVSDASPGTGTPAVGRFNISPSTRPMPGQAPLSWTGLGDPTHIGLAEIVKKNGVNLTGVFTKYPGLIP